ncbi:hypothetical protein D9757_009551 [Collybiopsis confluens]|uniref:Uncharacterized protein n=1 Tax=Collybiopsis confluens TaxID=2823264 RepID=A0A8H5M2U7_9AGAR|nr:hypothetical protein D9757_009551 [Collybiopsis confluens]
MNSLSAACLSTSANLEDLRPAQNFCLLQDRYIQYRLPELEYYWGLSRGELDPFSELNHVYVRADVAQLLWSKAVALVPTVDVLTTMAELVRDNFIGSFDCRRSCFESIPAHEYEYKLLPVAENGPSLYVLDQSGTNLQQVNYPYHDLPPLKLPLYPFFATTHAGEGFFDKGSTRDPEYSHPIMVMTAVYTNSAPLEFGATCPNPLLGSGEDLTIDDELTSDSESTFYSGHEGGRMQSWIQGTGDGYSKDPVVSCVG